VPAVKVAMKISVRIEDLYGGRVWVLTGTPRQVEAAILLAFAWLRGSDRDDLETLLEDLGSQQAFMVEHVEHS
jgi:hypothetical protein